jgi:hypothetical protein
MDQPADHLHHIAAAVATLQPEPLPPRLEPSQAEALLEAALRDRLLRMRTRLDPHLRYERPLDAMLVDAVEAAVGVG